MSAGFPRGLLALSFVLHLLALAALQFWGTASSRVPLAELDLRMVQLVGGGSNRPGWVRPPEAAPAQERPETITAPPEPRPAPPAAKPETVPATRESRVKPENPPAGEKRPADVTPTGGTAVRNPADGKGQDAHSSNVTPRDDEGAGPKGPGVDMVSEASGSPGISNWLRRSQGTLFQNFRFPARNSGRAAVYHFVVTPDGRITDTELVKGSGDSVLDHAGLVAIRTSKLSPLPPEARLKGLGVTITFRD